MQHVLLKPDVKGVEDDEDLPEDPVYVNYSLLLYIVLGPAVQRSVSRSI